MPGMNMRPFLSSLALLLAGCVGGQSGVAYPSLAKRPIESGGAVRAPATPPPAASAADPALEGEVARLSDQAKAGASAFDASYPKAEQQARAAAGSGVSSEAWVAAQVTLSGLESARNESVSALAELDTLYANRMSAVADGAASGGADVIDAARRDVLSTVDGQNDRLDRLKALLPQP